MFYISSRGHSATGWLAKQISKHNKVVCWHGTRSIPPSDPGVNDLSPSDFIKGLKILEDQRDERIYGAVHGFHGVSIKNEIELSKYLQKNLIRNEIVIGMGAGAISKWMVRLKSSL